MPVANQGAVDRSSECAKAFSHLFKRGGSPRAMLGQTDSALGLINRLCVQMALGSIILLPDGPR